MTECLSFRSINPIAELFYLNLHVFCFPSHFLFLFISNCSTKLLFVQILVPGIFVLKRVVWSLTPRIVVLIGSVLALLWK